MEIKYIDDENIENEKSKLSESETLFDRCIRTRFGTSFFFLLIEVFLPALLVWFLTGNDFAFSYEISFGLAWGLVFTTIVVAFLLTGFFYFLKWHKSDQFTYVITLAFVIMTIYISGFWWHTHLWYRILLAVAFLLLGILLGAIVSSLFYNLELKKIVSENENGDEIDDENDEDDQNNDEQKNSDDVGFF